MRAWVNGQLLDDPEAPAVGVSDHGLTVGDGVFEAVKVVDGRPFALTRHLERLARSAAASGCRRPTSTQVRARRSRRCWPASGCRWAGCGSPTPAGRRRWAPAAATARRRWSWSPRRWSPGPTTTAVATVPWPRNERGALAGLKTTSYAENVRRPRRGAKRRGAARRSSPTSPGTCARAPASNVFYVVDGELRTPTLAAGCLAGVTRALLLEWYGGREVDEPIEVLDRGRARSSWPPPPATSRPCARWDDRELDGSRSGDRRRVATLAAPRGRSCWASEHAARDVVPAGRAARVSLRIAVADRTGAIGAVVARFVHTEEVTGSNPVSPTARKPNGRPVVGFLAFPGGPVTADGGRRRVDGMIARC